MHNSDAIKALLQLNDANTSSGIVIYSKQKSARLDYVCRFIFHHVLKIKYSLVTEVPTHSAESVPVINYATEFNATALNIVPSGFLMQHGVSSSKPKPFVLNETLYFFSEESKVVQSANSFHFDIFSAIFYLISRYEEWQDFQKDKHQRFEVEQSCLYASGFYLKPIVEIWISELKSALLKLKPAFKFPDKHFQILSTIDVDNLFAFKHKGFIRSGGAALKDLLKGDFKNLRERVEVLLGKKEDPFDIYSDISDFCFENKIPLIYFFLFRNGDQYNRTLSPENSAFVNVFNTLKSNHAFIGIHPSYQAAYTEKLLQEELKNLSAKTGTSITLSRQHYLRWDIKTTPKLLLRNGIECDFTMGYASKAGFRAGTSHPFYYYDFENEASANLLLIPFCVMDGAYTVYANKNPDEALNAMLKLAHEIKKVNGYFISVYHERSFSNHLYPGFGTLYKNLHLSLKAL